MRKELTFIATLSLLFILNGCLIDIEDNVKKIIIEAKDIQSLTKDLNLAGYSTIPDTTDFPITAWFGIPHGQLNEYRFQELKDAGITINYYRYPNADSVQKALDLSQKVGIKTLINCPELVSNTKAIVQRFKNHPANAGYFIRDEPPVSMIPTLKSFINTVKSVDKDKLCYVNLLPLYGTGTALGTENYYQYIERYMNELPWDVVSFDFYPIENAGLRYGWYKNLEIIRDESNRIGKPFWAFALTTAHSNYPIPTLENLRLQVYSNLAYGAKGIQYYTYWTTISPNYVYVSGPIEKNGSKTDVYNHIKTLNKEIDNLAYIFKSTNVTNVSHYKNIPEGAKPFTNLPNYVKSFDIDGESAIISEMGNDSVSYLMIQNNSLHNPMAVDIKVDSLTNMVLKNGRIIPAALIKEKFKLTSGDVAVFQRRKNK